MSNENMKKTIITLLVLVLLVIIMAFTFTLPALMAGLPPATGDLYIHKYVGSAQDASNDGSKLNTSGWSAIPVNNIVFDLYNVGAAAAHVPEWPEYPSAGAYSIVDGNLEVTSEGAPAGVYALTPIGSYVTGDSGTIPEDGVAIAEGLARGIYLVVEDSTASRALGVVDQSGEPISIIAEIAPFLVAVPMTNVDGTGWLSAVHVYPKNERMAITKDVDIEGDAISVGDTVTYTITSTLPGDIATGESVEIVDVLDSALTLVPDTVEVTTIVATPLTKKTDGDGDYTVEYDDGTLTVSFTAAGITKLHGLTSVVVKFDCIINNGILNYIDFTISNVAKVEFTNEYSISQTNETDEHVDIHTAAIKVIKVSGSGAALSGAEFKIASSSSNAEAGHFIRIDPVTDELFDYDPTPGSDWDNLGDENDYKGTRDTTYTNIITFSGLRDVIDDVYQTYYIVETKAPEGYNLLSSAREVTFTGDEDNYTLEATVRNSTGFILPRTGGIGTIIWTASGIVFLGAAIIIFATGKKRLGSKG